MSINEHDRGKTVSTAIAVTKRRDERHVTVHTTMYRMLTRYFDFFDMLLLFCSEILQLIVTGPFYDTVILC